MPELCLLTVHAHPDDESSKGAGTVARYHAEGVHTVLVCCTGGEAGDILNPAMDRPEVRDRLAEVRRAELEEAAAIIGYDELVMLGYRDSGMPDTDANADPRSFAQAPLEEAVGRLVAVIRRTQPQVIVTYPDEKGYRHPDHLRVHEITVPAFDAAGDPGAFPEAGPVWEPLKLYYTTWSRRRILAMHEKFLELGMESPYDQGWFDRPIADETATTTTIDVSGFTLARDLALRAHATQVDPTSKFWFGLPPEVAQTVYPFEEYVLARSRVEVTPPEDDVFGGISDLVSR